MRSLVIAALAVRLKVFRRSVTFVRFPFWSLVFSLSSMRESFVRIASLRFNSKLYAFLCDRDAIHYALTPSAEFALVRPLPSSVGPFFSASLPRSPIPFPWSFLVIILFITCFYLFFVSMKSPTVLEELEQRSATSWPPLHPLDCFPVGL